MKQAIKYASGENCEKVFDPELGQRPTKIRFHVDHVVTAAVLDGVNPAIVNYVVLRDPRDRFVSQFYHLKRKFHEGAAELRDYNFDEGDPIKFGNALLNDNALHRRYFWDGRLVGEGMMAVATKPIEHHDITWKQSYYVKDNTEFACLPTISEDTQRIWNKYAPGCVANFSMACNVGEKALGDEDIDDEQSFREKDEVRELTERLYPEDWKLWEKHCARPAVAVAELMRRPFCPEDVIAEARAREDEAKANAA